jgi:ribosomal-protein-serine acetyltransferase
VSQGSDTSAGPISRIGDLQVLREDDAPELHDLIDANRAHLSPWLTWPGSQSFNDTLVFVRNGEKRGAVDDGLHYAIRYEGRIVGVVSYMNVNRRHRHTTLGYWLDKDHQGRGLAITAVSALVEHAFRVWKLNRVEIRAAVENDQSRALAERLGFAREGLLHQAEFVDGRFLDTVVFGMTAEMWEDRKFQR